jgi:hypothetical protein|tara:strand:+ start:1528 stop:2226 length:699 start_codon:yes stop_codon:yes gene_type:complete
MLTMMSLPAMANDIYITQSGAGLDLELTQDGQNNVFGTSAARVVLTGTGAVWTMSQIGDNNVIAATINGSTYTGTWAITGSTNDILFTCDASASSKCETVDVDIAINGDYSNIDIRIGANSAATNTNVTLDVDGNYNTFDADIDGSKISQTDAPTTVTLDNTCATCGTATSTTNNITMNYDASGDGDSAGHKLVYHHIGTGTVDIIQSGVYDTVIDASITSTGADVDITQTD